MRVLSLSLAVVFTMLTLGCGGGGDSDEDKIRSTVEDFAQAFADGDGDEVCDQLTTKAKQQLLEGAALLGGRGCPEMIELARGFIGKEDLAQLEDIKIESVKITGDRAEVVTDAKLDPEDEGPMRLQKVGDEWLVDADPDETSETSGDEQSTTPEEPAPTAEEEAAVETVEQDQPLVQDGYSVRLLDVRVADQLPGDEYTDPVKADGEFVILTLKVRNTGKKVATFDTALTKLVDVDGTEYSSETGGAEDQIGTLPDYLDEREIQPKTAETGDIAFDLPKAANVGEIRFADTLETFDENFTGAIRLNVAG